MHGETEMRVWSDIILCYARVTCDASQEVINPGGKSAGSSVTGISEFQRGSVTVPCQYTIEATYWTADTIFTNHHTHFHHYHH